MRAAGTLAGARVPRLLVCLVAALTLGLLGGSREAQARIGDGEPFISQQWGLTQIGAPDAWNVTRGGGVRIGVVDTGIDLRHEELSGGTIAESIRCVDTGGQASRCAGSAQDDNGHGTHVAGTIAAPLNGRGVAGVAPEASLLVVKALDAQGEGETNDVAAAIDWLVARDARVINLSLADASAVGQVLDSPIETSIRRAYAERGVIFVLAGGNKAEDGSTPAGATGGYGDLPALVVAATGPDGAPARYNIPLGSAQWGLAAPGGDGSSRSPEREIVSTYWYANQANGYAWSEGTSMAAPHVAGVAGLLAAQGLKGRAVVDRILGTVQKLDCGVGCRGRLDARAAVGAQVAAPPPAQVKPKPSTRSRSTAPTPKTTAPVPTTDLSAGAVSVGPASDPTPAPTPPTEPVGNPPAALGSNDPGPLSPARSTRPKTAAGLAALMLLAVVAATAVTAARQRRLRT